VEDLSETAIISQIIPIGIHLDGRDPPILIIAGFVHPIERALFVA
jgi:hypothetical protein